MSPLYSRAQNSITSLFAAKTATPRVGDN